MDKDLSIGDCRLICGDSRIEFDKLKLDYDKCILVSDTPFNIGYHYEMPL